MKKPKLTLVSENTNLKTYYVPLTLIQVDLYPVRANSPEQALRKANAGQFERVEKRVTLEEIQSNVVYTTTAMIKMQALISSAILFFPIGSVWFRNYSVTQTTGAKTMISRSEVDFSRIPTYLHTCKPTVSVVIPYESYIYMGGL